MGYIAVKGGAAAIENAETFSFLERTDPAVSPIEINQITRQFHLAIDRIMGEGSLYAPELAALAFKQAAGDTFEAAFILRSFRTTLPRIGYTAPLNTGNMRITRRISAAFKDIPGGQPLKAIQKGVFLFLLHVSSWRLYSPSWKHVESIHFRG